MSSSMISSIEVETIELEDELADFTADLLALQANEPILKRLFNKPAGSWSSVTDFFDETSLIEDIQSDCDGTLQITWLEPPELDSGYCLVLFYMASLGWNSLALYNKARCLAAV